jgi:hypothetical protein
MRNLLAFVGGAVLTFAGVGWYLDWYKIKSDPALSGHQNVNIDLNRAKIIQDVNKGIHKSEEKLQGVLDKDSTPPDASEKQTVQFAPATAPEPPRD